MQQLAELIGLLWITGHVAAYDTIN